MSEHFGAKLSFLGGVLVIDNVKISLGTLR